MKRYYYINAIDFDLFDIDIVIQDGNKKYYYYINDLTKEQTDEIQNLLSFLGFTDKTEE